MIQKNIQNKFGIKPKLMQLNKLSSENHEKLIKLKISFIYQTQSVTSQFPREGVRAKSVTRSQNKKAEIKRGFNSVQ